MKVVDVTEFYSERGGGVRSHLTIKGHVLCQLGHEHVVVAPGPIDAEIDVSPVANESSTSDATAYESTQFANAKKFQPGFEPAVEESARGSSQLSRSPDSRHSPRAPHRGRARVVRIGGPSLPYDPTYHLLWRRDKIREIVERERPDVLEIHSPYVAASSALRCRRDTFGVRTFCWHSDFIDTYRRVLLGGRDGVFAPILNVILEPLWSMVRNIGRECDATFVAAKWQRDKLEAHGVPRIHHVPFGIERDAFTADARSNVVRAELLGSARDRPGVKLLVGIGRFAVEKRWDVVIDAFKLLRKSHDAVLVLIGDGPERKRMEARTSGRDDVRFIGFEKDRKRLAGMLASADALVHGCPYETFGLSIAEAMSCGLPVVVPNEGGAAELADPASAETYASLDPRACRDAIVRLLAREPEALRRGALATASRVPNVYEQFATLCREYERLLASSQGTAYRG